MDSLNPTVHSVNWEMEAAQQGPDLTFYRQRAQATKARRQAAGRYAKPSKAQQAAFAKTMQRDGRKSLTAEEMGLLATHPYLAASQRAEFSEMARVAIESALQTVVVIASPADIERTIDSLFCGPVDGALQDAIDYGAELQELQDGIEDRMFWSRGGW